MKGVVEIRGPRAPDRLTMDEATLEKTPGFCELQSNLRKFLEILAACPR